MAVSMKRFFIMWYIYFGGIMHKLLIASVCLYVLSIGAAASDQKHYKKSVSAKEWKKSTAKGRAEGHENQWLIYAVNSKDNSLYTIDSATGKAQRVGALGIKIAMSGLSFDQRGRLWGFSLSQMERLNKQKMQKAMTSKQRRERNRNRYKNQKGLLYVIDTKTGKAEVKREFDLQDKGRTIGLVLQRHIY